MLPDGGSDSILDARLSPNGTTVGFVYQSEVYACGIAPGSEPIQLTHGARGTQVTHGVADFCAQEEMDRYEGYWISPDGLHLAFEAVDESHIPKFRIMHSGKDEVGPATEEDHHYPFAGEANPRFKLGVVRTDGKGEASPPRTPPAALRFAGVRSGK